MKKSTLFLLAAGVLVFTTLPVNAQIKVTSQKVQKESQKSQVSQTPATTPQPAAPQAAVKLAPVKTPTNPPAAAVVANPTAPTQVTPPPPPAPLTCTWDQTDYDFGKNVTQMKPASATYTLTNKGKEAITINAVQTSCGCTSPKYTKEPIKPGEKGQVVLTFNASVSGIFNKSAQVKLNDGQQYTLTIKGDVQKVEPAPPTTPAGAIK
jgi:hypothetical protein